MTVGVDSLDCEVEWSGVSPGSQRYPEVTNCGLTDLSSAPSAVRPAGPGAGTAGSATRPGQARRRLRRWRRRRSHYSSNTSSRDQRGPAQSSPTVRAAAGGTRPAAAADPVTLGDR